MSKGIELTTIQIKAYNNGATMFLFPIDKINNDWLNKADNECFEYFIAKQSPIQKGDKDIGIDNTIFMFQECIDVKVARVKDLQLSHCQILLDLRVPLGSRELVFVNNRANGESFRTINQFKVWYNQQMKEQNIKRTYEDNDYVFLIEFKR